jgi:hypothetical protein
MVDVRVPEAWENHTIHTFVSPTRDRSFSGNITVAPYETDATVSLEQVVAGAPLSNVLDDLLVLERGYKTRGVSRYHERTIRFVEPQQGLLLQQRQRFVMIKRKPFIFTFTDTADEFAGHSDAFDEIFAKMIDPVAGAS